MSAQVARVNKMHKSTSVSVTYHKLYKCMNVGKNTSNLVYSAQIIGVHAMYYINMCENTSNLVFNA